MSEDVLKDYADVIRTAKKRYSSGSPAQNEKWLAILSLAAEMRRLRKDAEYADTECRDLHIRELKARRWRKQGNEAIRVLTDQREALLAWQRGVREAMPMAGHVYTRVWKQKSILFTVEDWDKLRLAIEREAGKEDEGFRAAQGIMPEKPGALSAVETLRPGHRGEAGKEET